MLSAAQRDIGRVSVLVAPASDPVDIDGEGGVKKHLRVDHASEDDEIQNALRAATNEIDAPRGWLGRSLITRTLRLTLDGLPPRILYLPGPPVTKVDTITVRDADDNIDVIYDVDTAVDLINLQSDLTAEPALIWPDRNVGWPSDIQGGPDSVRVDYIAGYANSAAIPDVIRQWLLMRTGELYRDRESSIVGTITSDLDHAARSLDNWRVRG